MNLLYSINSTNYKPISFRERYFYDYYEIINSFLKTKLNAKDNNRLLKPMLNGDGNINWYGDYSGDFKRLTEWDPQIINKVKLEFEQFILATQELAKSLKNKQDDDNKAWGDLISDLFQHDCNILINNDQGEWGILWGWDFMTNGENKLPELERFEAPITSPDPIPSPEPISSPDPIPSPSPDPIPSPIPIPVPDPIPSPIPIPVPSPEEPEEEEKEVLKQRMGCFGRIKHFLRWVSYRFWALFWLIIYTLLIIWLCRHCDRPNCDAYCEKLKKTKEELKHLEERVRERCDTTYVKPI